MKPPHPPLSRETSAAVAARRFARINESSGPAGRLRGTAQDLASIYARLAHDAWHGGDRVKAWACLQHAEHYTRILNAIRQELVRQASPVLAPQNPGPVGDGTALDGCLGGSRGSGCKGSGGAGKRRRTSERI